MKFWRNMKMSSKITLFVVIIVIVLISGWFSDYIPSLILNHYREEYTLMPKDKETGFPSYKDRTESGGMGAFMTMAYWYDMAQQRSKAHDCYVEALYRYGYDHPRAPELLVDVMEDTMHGSNADSTEPNAVLYFWLFATKYDEKHPKKDGFNPHPAFEQYRAEIEQMIRSRGSRILLPVADNNYDLNVQVLTDNRDKGANVWLKQFIYLNREQKINDVDLKAVGTDIPEDYLPYASKISEFSIKDWE